VGIFEILSEAKIREWLSRPKYKTPPENSKAKEPVAEKSFEGHLLDQIKGLIKKAAEESGAEREKTIAEANGLEIQLLVSLENDGRLLMAKKTQQIIFSHKTKHLYKGM